MTAMIMSFIQIPLYLSFVNFFCQLMFFLQPSCSLHMNLMYGAVYRVSPSQQLLSSDAAPGLVVSLGNCHYL